MQSKSIRSAFVPLLAVLIALGAILLGALFLIAPVWQPGYRSAREPAEPSDGTADAVPEPAAGTGVPTATLLNINTATAEELTALPGIGAARAAAIVAWRDENGPFAALEDLEKIGGISHRMVESWQELAEAGTVQP